MSDGDANREPGAAGSPAAADPDEVTIVVGDVTRSSSETELVNALVRQIDGPIDRLWELLTTAPGSNRWLGCDGPPAPGVPFASPVAGQLRGYVGSMRVEEATRTIFLDLHGRAKPVSVALVAAPGDTTIVHVEDQLLSFEPRTRDAWVRVVNAIAECHDEVAARKPRQAVVVVHGIGEQRPGKTIEGFVDAIVGPQMQSTITSYPFRSDDAGGDGYETRRYRAVAADDYHPDSLGTADGLRSARPETDFYEYYWAHHAGDTKLRQVFAWLVRLLLHKPTTPGTRRIWFGGWLLILGSIAGGVTQANNEQLPAFWIVLSVLAIIGLALAWFMRGYVGDAARYLGNAPYNVKLRRRIRREAVGLLRHLHESGDYDRVVVVGHSLGSVVAYDMVRRYWTEIYAAHARSVAPGHDAAAGVGVVARDGVVAREGAVADGGPPDDAAPHDGSSDDERHRYQRAQHDLWEQQRRSGHRWLVTDFVTLGSPLTHAEVLLSDGKGDFARRKAQLELPTCPPTSEGGRAVGTLDHGAVFALTRWTNLHYSAFGFGDPVGGPLAPAFGSGVTDRAVRPGLNPLYWSVLGHLRYARGPGLGAVLDALRLGSADTLADLHADLPVGQLLKPDTNRR